MAGLGTKLGQIIGSRRSEYRLKAIGAGKIKITGHSLGR